jgi:predicted protein tyrosine phosphatase
MKKLVYAVCGLNASRSKAIEEFLKGKYSNTPEIEIKSAGLDVDILRKEDKRTLFNKELAEKADVIFASDHDKLYRINYQLLENDTSQTKKVHLLSIPDIFHIHRNAHLGDLIDYIIYLERINLESEFSSLRRYISHLKPKAASELMEALYVKELYSAHRSPELRQDKKYPFELLYKTLEFRFDWMSQIIKNIN